MLSIDCCSNVELSACDPRVLDDLGGIWALVGVLLHHVMNDGASGVAVGKGLNPQRMVHPIHATKVGWYSSLNSANAKSVHVIFVEVGNCALPVCLEQGPNELLVQHFRCHVGKRTNHCHVGDIGIAGAGSPEVSQCEEQGRKTCPEEDVARLDITVDLLQQSEIGGTNQTLEAQNYHERIAWCNKTKRKTNLHIPARGCAPLRSRFAKEIA